MVIKVGFSLFKKINRMSCSEERLCDTEQSVDAVPTNSYLLIVF